MMKTTSTQRFIRWLLALTGADPNQLQVPSARKPVDITVQRQGDTHVAIIQGNAQRQARTNVVYVIGEVVQPVDGQPEIMLVTDPHKPPVRVRGGAGLPDTALRALREGDLIVLIGELHGDYVQASRIHRLNSAPRQRIYG